MSNKKEISIAGRKIGEGHPAYVIAELSANHNQDVRKAVKLIEKAHEAGVDAIKIQTYRADTITIDCDSELFRIQSGSLWDGKTLYQLYEEAYTPWEWHDELREAAESRGLHFFSSPFDFTAVDFLEAKDVPAYKIASFELVDLPLIEKVAKTGKPMIMSTGMANIAEIHEAITTARQAGATEIVLLKTNSGYPAPYEEMNLRTIPNLSETFGVPAGLSDHTLGIAVPVAAVALGATVIEKHLTMSRSEGGPDSKFSLEPEEFKAMVEAIRIAEKSLGNVAYATTTKEKSSKNFRRSLFVIKDMEEGEVFSDQNVRSIRPGDGLHTRHLNDFLGKRAGSKIKRGTPLSWDLLIESQKEGQE
jgi:pseudaminic acid synthase